MVRVKELYIFLLNFFLLPEEGKASMDVFSGTDGAFLGCRSRISENSQRNFLNLAARFCKTCSGKMMFPERKNGSFFRLKILSC